MYDFILLVFYEDVSVVVEKLDWTSCTESRWAHVTPRHLGKG